MTAVWILERLSRRDSEFQTTARNSSFDSVYNLQVHHMLEKQQNSTGVSAVRCIPMSSPQITQSGQGRRRPAAALHSNLISSLLVEDNCLKRAGVTPADVQAAFSTINKPWKPLLRERAAWLRDLGPVSLHQPSPRHTLSLLLPWINRTQPAIHVTSCQ